MSRQRLLRVGGAATRCTASGCRSEEALEPVVATVNPRPRSLPVAGLTGCSCCCAASVQGRYDGAQPAVVAALDARRAVRIPGAGPLDSARVTGPLRGTGGVLANEYLVRYRSPEGELIVFGNGRAIVKGSDDAVRARPYAARFVGV